MLTIITYIYKNQNLYMKIAPWERVGKLYISFVNEQYEYMHETYGSVEMYTIYNLLLFIGLPMPLPDTLIDYMCFYIFKIVVCHEFLFLNTCRLLSLGQLIVEDYQIM